MTWNEPGGSRDKDPWGGRGGNEQGPPDLDEVIKKLQDKLGGLFGGAKGGGNSDSAPPKGILSMALLGALVIWALSGIYTIDAGKQGVVIQLGAYHETVDPGLHWVPTFIQKVETVDVENIFDEIIGDQPAEAIMLTKDENIVDIQFSIQYRIKDPQDYLFNVRSPELTLRHATESAVREVVGKSSWDTVTTEGRTAVVALIDSLLQEILDSYQTGLEITSVNMQHAREPTQVKEAFADVNNAREDASRMKNEALAYSNDVVPRARGNAARLVQEAEAYKARVMAEAEGDATRFNQVLREYNKAPRVTRERLYLETMEEIYSKSKKIVVDVKGGNNMMYLPLDQIVKQQQGGSSTNSTDMNSLQAPSVNTQSNGSRPGRDSQSSRGIR
ncbi:MAG: FtsH protease activity modulator HflK [Gammaproteobacteria bacterium]|nr:FtsH protease activity modulator HflK [Gammaproteobacteria bacterium]